MQIRTVTCLSLPSLSFFFLSSFTKLETFKPFSSHFWSLHPPTIHKPTNCNSQISNPPPLFGIHHCTNHQKSNPSTIADPPTPSTSQQILLHKYNENKNKKKHQKKLRHKIHNSKPKKHTLTRLKRKSQLKSKPSAIIAWRKRRKETKVKKRKRKKREEDERT